jgi:peptide deformylase
MLKLIPEHDPRLRQPSLAPCEDFDRGSLAQSLLEVLLAENAVGISAVQCGILIRVFLLRDHDTIHECWNPRIIEQADT